MMLVAKKKAQKYTVTEILMISHLRRKVFSERTAHKRDFTVCASLYDSIYRFTFLNPIRISSTKQQAASTQTKTRL